MDEAESVAFFTGRIGDNVHQSLMAGAKSMSRCDVSRLEANWCLVLED